MRVFAISDLHLSFGSNKPMDIFGGNWENYLEKIVTDWKEKVTDEDIVLIAGDISWAIKLENTKEDFSFLGSLPGKKVIIRGNHDYWWTTISAVRRILPPNVYAIQNDSIRFGEFVICGTRGWIVSETGAYSKEDLKIFNREVIRLDLTLSSAKKKENEKLICMMHYPPFNTKQQESEFTKLIKKYDVDAVVFGHIHSKNSKIDLQLKKDEIDYYLTSCDMLCNKLIQIF